MDNENKTNEYDDDFDVRNFRLHAQNLSIPILERFKKQENDNPQMIMLATTDGLTEQLVSDGPLDEGETFEERIDAVIKATKEFMRENGMDDNDKSFIYVRDYKTADFNFKVYVQDMIVNVDNAKKAIRQYNLYFVEPKFNDFYQFSIGAGPFDVPTEVIKLGEVDIANDEVTMVLDTMATTMMDNLKYNK